MALFKVYKDIAPSIEDKINRFAENHHQLFAEPKKVGTR